MKTKRPTKDNKKEEKKGEDQEYRICVVKEKGTIDPSSWPKDWRNLEYPIELEEARLKMKNL